MESYSLAGIWQVYADGHDMTATVPGSVYSALLENGYMEDPYYRDNELSALEIMKQDFMFKKKFKVPETICRSSHVLLHCDGLDTLCELYLNGTKIGSADNFHRIWEFDIKDMIREDGNELVIHISSPINYIKEQDKAYHLGGSRHAMRGFPHLRKPHCMFGWDWGPRLPDAGIWNQINILAFEDARLQDVYIEQQHGRDEVGLSFRIRHTGEADIKVTIKNPKGEIIYEGGRTEVAIENPQLWWPNGLGSQPLYEVTIELLQEDVVVDSMVRRIGLRTMTVVREKDQWGESFAHCVNGQTFFAMGADYIPEDNLFQRITPERTRKLLEKCKFANFNAIRVWGGGNYPSDEFFDICDELGMVVWQDFMFCCANYHLTDTFEENITRELEDNIRRIRHHASLGLWCGNNEMEMFAKVGEYDGNDITRGFYIRMYEHIIPHILKREDPNTFYWPASPSSGGSFDEPNAPDRGDVHYWEVWHGGVPFSEYRKYFFRYASEFGFQSFPSLKTVESFTLQSDRNIFSRVMEMHQRNEGANGKILQYLSKTYLYPNDFETLLYTSQLLQADAIRYGVEHWRRNRGRCMGAIYWQLNDIWPVASWSSVDYFGRLKALHYCARRFFAPVMISCEEVCETTARTSVVMEPGAVVNTARLCVANETWNAVSGEVRWKSMTPDSKVVMEGAKEVEVEAFSSEWLEQMDFGDMDYRRNHLYFEFVVGGNVLSSGTVLFTAPKHYYFQNPMLSVTLDGNQVTVKAEAYAKSVEIYSHIEDFVLSDNFFDMEAGTVTLTVLEGNAKHLKVRSVYDIR